MLTDDIKVNIPEPLNIDYDYIKKYSDKMENEYIQPTGSIFEDTDDDLSEQKVFDESFKATEKEEEEFYQQLLEI
jgi:hypothetical protein